jgi:hypothetical protein
MRRTRGQVNERPRFESLSFPQRGERRLPLQTMDDQFASTFVLGRLLTGSNNEANQFHRAIAQQSSCMGRSQGTPQGPNVDGLATTCRHFRLRPCGCMEWGPDDQHRTARFSQYSLRHATGEEPSQPCFSMSTHDNKVARERFG